MLQEPIQVTVSTAPSTKAPTLWRWALASAGLLCFGLGMVGAVVPGMPTTVFLLIGSFCLTKSCPWLEQRLLNTRLLRPYARFITSKEPMPAHSRVVAISAMSVCVFVSGAMLIVAGKMSIGLFAAFVAMWATAFVSILCFRRSR